MLQVVLVSRKPAARKLVRSIAKEVDLLEMLRRMPNVEARLLDLATLTISEQLYLITHTDLLIGELSHFTVGAVAPLMSHSSCEC